MPIESALKDMIIDKNGVPKINSWEDKSFTNKKVVGMYIPSLQIYTLSNLYFIFIFLPLALDKVWIVFSKY